MTSTMIKQNWSLAYVAPPADLAVRDALSARGFDAYVPMIAGPRRSGGRMVPEPMFPRYVFVRNPFGQAGWRTVFSTAGIVKVLMWGATPAMLSNGVIEAIRAREADGLVVMEAPPFQRFEPVIFRGETADIAGVFLERVDSDRVCILVGLLSGSSRPSKNVVPLRTLLRPRAEACPESGQPAKASVAV